MGMDKVPYLSAVSLMTTQAVNSQSQGPSASHFLGGNPFAQEEAAIFEKCKPCDGEVDASLSLDGLTCSEWLEFASQVPANTEECAMERMLGWKYCGCPSHIQEHCSLCDSGNKDIQRGKQLPFSSITCDAFVDVPAIDGETTCNLAKDFAAYCGCQGAAPQCTLCADGAPPQNIDAPLYLGMTCSDIQDLHLVASDPQRCAAIAADYPFDLQAYCGCNNALKPHNECAFCPYGGILHNHTQTLQSDDTSTCGDWENLASFAKEGESSCAVFQYVGLECCDSMALPDFFATYFDDSEEAGKLSTTQVQQPAQEPELVLESEPSQQAEGVTSDFIVPFVEGNPPAENISMAVLSCFAKHTSAVSPEVGTGHLDTVRDETLIEQAKEGFGNLFHGSQASTAPNVNRGPTSPIMDLSNEAVAPDKWEQLFRDIANVKIPSNFLDLVPKEYSDHSFLEGLPGCLETAFATFSDCFLCPNGEKPSAEKMIPITGLYCDEYDAWKKDSTAQDCKSLEAWLPFDMASWCGCPGVPDRAEKYPVTQADEEEILDGNKNDNKCSFCPEGSILVLDSWRQTIDDKTLLDGYEVDSTCAEWAQMADYATTEEGCSALRRIAAAGCCEEIGESILDSTPAPVPGPTGTTAHAPTKVLTAVPVVGSVSVDSGASWFNSNWNCFGAFGLSLFAFYFS